MGALNDYIDEVGEDTLLQVVNKKWVLTALDRYTTTINVIYPVGSIYMSVNNINPGTYLTGTTWVVWGSGKVPVGVNTAETEFGSVEKTGGEKNHALTINELASHNHTQTQHRHAIKAQWPSGSTALMYDSGNGTTETNPNIFYTQYTQPTIQNEGGNQAHNNLQPYITCYMFKRIA